jgi:hypothetical protein
MAADDNRSATPAFAEFRAGAMRAWWRGAG